MPDSWIIESARILLQQRVSLLNTVVNVCMVWWTSSVVFSVSILGMLWQKKGQLGLQPRQARDASLLLTLFFLTNISFGLTILVYLLLLRYRFEHDLPLAGMSSSALSVEIWTTFVAVLLGTLTLGFVFGLWWKIRSEVLCAAQANLRAHSATDSYGYLINDCK